jgi:transcription elongation factor/antiterminator RfaH
MITALSESGEARVVEVQARWYAAQTLHRRERGAELQLEAQGFTSFLPQITRTVRHARQLRTVRTPLFPSYVFVRLDLERDRWRSVNGTYGVARLVMADGRPVPVPNGVVESLFTLRDGNGVVRLDHDLSVGQRIKVIAGPFAQTLGALTRLDGPERVQILLDMMGGKVSVTIPRACLRAA